MKTFMCIRMFFIPLASRLVFSQEDPEFHLVLSINARHFWSSMILGGSGVTITVSCSVLEVEDAVFEVRKAVSVIISNASIINSLIALPGSPSKLIHSNILFGVV